MCLEIQSEVKWDGLSASSLMLIKAIFIIKFKHCIIVKKLKIILKRCEMVLDEIPMETQSQIS